MTALATLLADPAQAISFVVRFDERDPATDTVTTRNYQTANRFGAEGYPALLQDPGGRSDKLEADELAAIAVQTVVPVRLVNEPLVTGGDGPLDFLLDRTLAGRAITILAGHPNEAIANYEAVATGVMDREPAFDGGVVEIRVKSPLERLNVDLGVGTYVGEPGALRNLVVSALGRAEAAYFAAHDLTSFTVAIRHKFIDNTTAEAAIQKTISSTNSNFQILKLGDKRIWLRWSEGGVAKLLQGPLVTGDFQVIVAGFDAGRSAYLMVDGVVENTVTPGTPNLPAAGVKFGASAQAGAEWLDARLFNHYIAPDEMRSAMAVRADGGEEGLVGLWRGDDNTGSTLTDYSPTGAHATISGTEGVDFEHVSSDLGTAELAGRSMPVIIGSVWNAPADLVDPERERWRVNDRLYTWNSTKVRDEGEELSASTDYDWTDGDPVLEMVAEAGEPVTVGVDEGTTAMADHVLGVSVFSPSASLLVDRGPLTASTLDLTPYLSQYPNKMGISTRRRRVSEALREVLGGSLGHAFARRDGTVVLDSLVAPVAPGPRGEACLSIISTGGDRSGVDWDTPAGVLGGESFTLACWVKALRSGPADLASSEFRLITLRRTGFENHAVAFWFDPNPGTSSFELETRPATGFDFTRVSFPYAGFSDAPQWVFVAVVHDDLADTTSFYAAVAGEALTLLGSTSGLGLSATPDVDGVVIGGEGSGGYFRGSVAEPQVWDDTLSLAELQALMDAAPGGNETDLAFYAPLNGASTAALTDTVSSEVGTLQGTAGNVREVPDLEIDLRLDPATFRTRSYRPAKSIRVEYRRNDAVLDPANITATVTQEEALALINEGLYAVWKSGDIEADYEDALEIELSSRWYTVIGAMSTLLVARHRYAPGRELVDVTGANRRALLLEIGDEVRVYGGARWGLEDGLVYRVIANNARFGDLTCDLGLWR